MKKSKKAVIISIAVVLLIIIGIIFAVISTFGRIKKNEIPKDNEGLGISQNNVETKRNIRNIVFFGVDDGKSDGEVRSDSIIVISIDQDNNKIKATSIMRDSYVPIEGHGNDKINAAYALGGPTLAIKTINSNFGLDVKEYVKVDFRGLEKIVNKIGGVQINVKASEVPYCSVKSSGLQTLNGRQALEYSRIRKVGTDFERTQRQRKVLGEIFKKIKAQGAVKLPGTISTFFPYIETNLSNTEIMGLAKEAISYEADKAEQFRIPMDGTYTDKIIKGLDVLVIDIEKNKQGLEKFIYGEK